MNLLSVTIFALVCLGIGVLTVIFSMLNMTTLPGGERTPVGAYIGAFGFFLLIGCAGWALAELVF